MAFTGKTAQMQVGYSSEPGRPEADFYRTCPEATHALMAVEPFDCYKKIWEPACGDGAISEIIKSYGLEVYSSDLYDYGYYDAETGRDFLTSEAPEGVTSIVTNPPFKISAGFALRGAEIVRKTGGKLCLLNRLLWLEGVARRKMFMDTRLVRVWVFSRRVPIMHRPDYDGKKTTPMVAFAWYIWDYQQLGPTQIRWIDWKEHIP